MDTFWVQTMDNRIGSGLRGFLSVDHHNTIPYSGGQWTIDNGQWTMGNGQ